MARLEYFFDYVSPFAYLADTQLPAFTLGMGVGCWVLGVGTR